MYFRQVSNHPQLNALLLEGILEEIYAVEVGTALHSAIEQQLQQSRRKVRIIFPYDLRTDQVIKSLDCIKGDDWTAFVNSKQTLVHVMRFNHPSILIRLPKLQMKGFSNTKMASFIANLLYEVL